MDLLILGGIVVLWVVVLAVVFAGPTDDPYRDSQD